ncbi:MAG: hydroxymethylbilane synthase [Bacteroidia bacterium]|nr:hydroxymethylbilane synthase [Bacteroidia bacterium]
MRKIVLGTRGSDLALWQARFTQELLEKHGHFSELKIIRTFGDQIQELKPTFLKTGEKGIFSKELEEALLKCEIDIAVHSLKDLPVDLPEGLMLGGVSSREDPSEALLIKKKYFDPSLPLSLAQSTRIGTSSLRRLNQIKFLREDIEIIPVRGNVPTRLKKFLKNSDMHGIMLAAAGLKRLGIPQESEEYITVMINESIIVPAPGQGAIAWEIRSNDEELYKILQEIQCPVTAEAVIKERELMHGLQAGCHAPLGICLKKTDNEQWLYVSYSPQPEKSPIRLCLRVENKDLEVQKALKILNYNQYQKIFVSKNPEEWSLLYASLASQGHFVQMQSLLAFECIAPPRLPDHEAVFFCSPRCVKFYFDLYKEKINHELILGCMGTGTERKLKKFGHFSHFTGNSNNPKQVMESFRKQFQHLTVLIPVAEKHSSDVEAIFNDPTKHFIVPIYRTIPIQTSGLENFDLYVLTSSSNVEALFSGNPQININAKYIAIGNNTKNKLVEFGVKKILAAKDFAELSVLASVYEALVL